MRLRFDDLAIDPDSRQLWLGDDEVHLSPKAFELLAWLVECRPRAIPKAEIHERLWAGTFVSETSLPSLVSEIRAAIADRRRTPRFIRTLHGFGYAFQASERSAGESIPSAPAQGWLIGSQAEIALSSGENVIGRERRGVNLLQSSAVSRRHARITIDARGAVVEDLGSKNGTYVNDQRVVGPTPVSDGDRIRLGSALFTFRWSQPTDTTESLSSHAGGGG